MSSFGKEKIENYQTIDESEESESEDSLSSHSEKFPEAFLEAIRHQSTTGFFSDGNRSTSSSEHKSSSTDGSADSKASLSKKLQTKATMIPVSVMAALNNIQRSQLRRVRKEATVNLEDILRNVVKTVDQYYVDHYPRDVLVPAKKMIGNDAQEEEEKRIKAEIKKILKGDVMQQLEDASLRKIVQRRDSVSLTQRQTDPTGPRENDGEKNEEREEEKCISGGTHVVGDPEVPACQVMLNIIDELYEISDQRENILNEVLEWIEGYPPDSIPNFPLSFEEENAEPIENIFENEKVMDNWSVNNNIRRLSVLSEEMGLVQIEDTEKRGEKAEDKQRKFLEEKMNKQRSKFISTKVFDVELLGEAKNWNVAVRAIAQVFDEAATLSSNERTKQTYRNAQKQFHLMSTLSEKRQEEKTKLGLQVNDLTGKLIKEKKETKSLRKKKHILETQAEKNEDEIIELVREMEIRDETISEQTTQIYELEIMNEEMIDNQQTLVYVQTPQAQPAQQIQAPIPTTEVENKTATTEKECAPPPKKTVKAKVAKQPKARPVQAGHGAKRKDTKDGEKRSKPEKDEPSKSSVIMSLKEAKAELEEIRKAGEARESKIKEFKLKLASEAEKFEQEKAKLKEEIEFHKMQTDGAKKQLEIEQEAWDQVKNAMTQEQNRLTNEVEAKEEIINYQEQRIQEVAREMTLSLMRAGLQAGTSSGRGDATDKLLESKQLLAKLHLQYEYEMDKLREFVNRESERHLAEMRRLELEHKRDLNVIYRDTSVIFRAVNRFKECLAVLLDREGLEDAAYGIRNIPNLFEDETTDTHIRLARMAGSVTELMVQMEFKMSQALMNKRMEIKDTSLAKNFLSKDLETREELLKKARELGTLQAEKLKQVRNELSSQEVEFLKLKHTEEDKHFDMIERNKDLTKQSQVLNKELTALQKELQEETTLKEEQEQEVEKIKMAMKKTIEQQEVIIANLQAENMRITGEQKLNMKKSDMMRNIKLLNDALAAKKISTEKHMVAMTMIEKTMEVSGLRIVHLVRKYVLQRSWKKICEAVKVFRKSNKRPPKVEMFLQNVEKGMEEKKKRWQERKAELFKTRTEIYMHFRNMCNELNKEDGIYLIRPTIQKVQSFQSLQQGSDQECFKINRKQKLLKNIPRKATVDIGSIAGVKGFQFLAPNITHQTSWQLPLIQTTQSSIVTPKILDMEINKARESCQRVLTSKSCGDFKDGGVGVKSLPWYQRQKARNTLFCLPPIASLYPEN